MNPVPTQRIQRVRSRQWSSDDAVSDVIGSILLVAVTVGMMVALGSLILNIEGPVDPLRADLQLSVLRGPGAWGDGDEVLRLRHLGGEEVTNIGTVVRLAINGTVTEYKDAALDGSFADGLTIGETWSVVTTIPLLAQVDVDIINADLKTLVATTSFVATPGQVAPPILAETFPITFTDTKGTTTDFANAQNDADGDLAAKLDEQTNPPSTPTTRLDPTNVAASAGVTSPSNVYTANNVRVEYADNGDSITLTGFNVPASALTIQNVKIGFEGQRGSGGGADPQASMSYAVGGLPGPPKMPQSVPHTADQDTVWDVTADRVWLVSSVEALEVTISRSNTGGKSLFIDHIWVEVTYDEVPTTDLDVEFAWSGVPAGTFQQLQVRYQATTDEFAMLVWDGASWVQRAVLSSTSMSVTTINLSPSEYAGGFPKVRFVDTDASSGAGRLEVEYAKVVTS